MACCRSVLSYKSGFSTRNTAGRMRGSKGIPPNGCSGMSRFRRMPSWHLPPSRAWNARNDNSHPSPCPCTVLPVPALSWSVSLGEFIGSEKNTEDTITTAPAKDTPALVKKIGRTTYIVHIHFSKTSKETMSDKIKRMLINKIRQM